MVTTGRAPARYWNSIPRRGDAAVRFDQDMDRRTAAGVGKLLKRLQQRRGALRSQRQRRQEKQEETDDPKADNGDTRMEASCGKRYTGPDTDRSAGACAVRVG